LCELPAPATPSLVPGGRYSNASGTVT
jgi:hypothetical protein